MCPGSWAKIWVRSLICARLVLFLRGVRATQNAPAGWPGRLLCGMGVSVLGGVVDRVHDGGGVGLVLGVGVGECRALYGLGGDGDGHVLPAVDLGQPLV